MIHSRGTVHGYTDLGATAIEYVPITSSPTPPKTKSVLEQRKLSRYGRRLSTAFRPDTLKFRPDAYAFGDDAPVTSSGDSLVLQQILTETKTQTAWLERWVKKDELQRYLQIAATLAIPLSAAIWRMIFRTARGE